MSAPLPPRIVSLPAPPSIVSLISAARLPAAREDVVAAVDVEDEVFGRADVDAKGAGLTPVEAYAGTVRGDREDLGAVAAVDLDGIGARAALEEVGVVARVPDHAVVAAFAEHLVVAIAAGQRVVAVAAEQEVVAALAEKRIVAGLPEQHVAARAAGDGVVAGAAEQVGARQRAVGFVEGDGVVAALAEDLDQAGIGDGAVPPMTTAPPLTRMVPAASRLTVIVLSSASPNMVSTPLRD